MNTEVTELAENADVNDLLKEIIMAMAVIAAEQLLESKPSLEENTRNLRSSMASKLPDVNPASVDRVLAVTASFLKFTSEGFDEGTETYNVMSNMSELFATAAILSEVDKARSEEEAEKTLLKLNETVSEKTAEAFEQGASEGK